jgi:DNA-binding response OmpR family regulator
MRAGLQVLLVEDDEIIARALTMKLNVDGHQVRWAYSAATALDYARDVPPEAVLLDIGLPDRDGYALARDLRAGVLPTNAAIIVLTGLPRASPVRADEHLIDLHLMKPIDVDQLSSLLHYARHLRTSHA